MTKTIDDRIIMEKAFAFGATSIMIVATRIANINIIAILVDSERNIVGKEVFVALIAEQILIRKATGANVGTVMDKSHLAFVEILLAVFTKAIIFVQTTFADVNELAVAIENVPCFRAVILTLLTEFATIVIAIVAQKL